MVCPAVGPPSMRIVLVGRGFARRESSECGASLENGVYGGLGGQGYCQVELYSTRNLLYLKRLKYSIKIQRIGTAKLYTPRTY